MSSLIQTLFRPWAGPAARLLCGAALLTVACSSGSELLAPDVQAPPGPMAAIGVDPVTGATIETDKDDYQPGDTVTITGSRWLPGETVHLHISEDPPNHPDHNWDVTADANGEFVHQQLVMDSLHVDVTFTLTATGRTSGSVAQTTFTDHGPSPVTSTNFSITVDVNNQVTVSVTLGGGATTVSLTTAEANIDGLAGDLSLLGPGGNGNGAWTGSFQGACETTYKINNIKVTWRTDHDHQATETPGPPQPQVTTGACPATNNPPQITLTGDDTADEGDTKSYSFTTDDPDEGDTFTLVEATCGANGTKANQSFDPATGAGSFDCTFPDGPVTSTVSVTVSDGTDSDTDSIVVTVNNVAPTVSAITGLPTDPIPINTTVYGCVTFTDPAGALDQPYSAVFDWNVNLWNDVGPLTSNAGPFNYGENVCSSHTYTATGVYAVQVGVTDKDGDTGYSPVYEYVVVYDPAAGFVTGGGWINSPSGAYLADETLVGRANFAFVSQYQKRGTNLVLTGNTQFVFQAAGLNFHSSYYDWLVVTGMTRAAFKGYGTLNGVAGYQFMVSVVDGGTSNPDKFRIKIWNDYGVIYDNQVAGDSGDDAEPTTVIAGGSIVIHTGGNKNK